MSVEDIPCPIHKVPDCECNLDGHRLNGFFNDIQAVDFGPGEISSTVTVSLINRGPNGYALLVSSGLNLDSGEQAPLPNHLKAGLLSLAFEAIIQEELGK
jgi:hypothetical protein